MASNPLERTYELEGRCLRASLAFDLDTSCESRETELRERGVAVPLPHSVAWLRAATGSHYWYLMVTDEGSGKCECAFPIEVTRSRALPGHLLLRVERFESAVSPTARRAALAALNDFAQGHRRVLRLNLEVVSRDPQVRDDIARTIRPLGFQSLSRTRNYRHTIGVDLGRDEDEILRSLHRTARRHIRAVQKRPVSVRLIEDPVYADRLGALLKETLSRTGGQDQGESWGELIDFSARHPRLVRVVGLFRDDSTDSDGLLAFAVGRNHGDHVEYGAAASSRPSDLRMPLGYALAWDLICWARQCGARWFDFGGVTLEDSGGDDPLAGISDFKRYFSKELLEVGAEWMLEPHPAKGRLARAISGGSQWLSKLGTRERPHKG